MENETVGQVVRRENIAARIKMILSYLLFNIIKHGQNSKYAEKYTSYCVTAFYD